MDCIYGDSVVAVVVDPSLRQVTNLNKKKKIQKNAVMVKVSREPEN